MVPSHFPLRSAGLTAHSGADGPAPVCAPAAWGRLPVAHLLQNARRELHGLVVLLLQHVHVQVVQKVVSVVVQPALVQLGESSSQHASIPLLSFSQFAIFKNSHFLGEKHFQGSLPCCLALD